MLNTTKLLSASLFVLLSLSSFSAYATWSIIAVDRATGEIGIAGASCTFDVSGIASLVPGKGAIVVQAASNYFARMQGVSELQNGSSAEAILEVMKAEKFAPERQQYGVILLQENTKPLVYSGNEIKQWRGSKVGDDVAVLGNILVGEEVANKAYNAFNHTRDAAFSNRVMSALKAGEEASGDNRCAKQAARSAFISIYNPESDAITKLSVYGTEEGGKAAVTLLQSKFDKLYQN